MLSGRSKVLLPLRNPLRASFCLTRFCGGGGSYSKSVIGSLLCRRGTWRASFEFAKEPARFVIWRTGEMSKSGRGVSRSTARVLLCVVATFSSMAGKPCAPFADICAKSTRNLAGLLRGWLRPCSIIGCLRHFRMRARSGVSHAVLMFGYRFSW